MASPNYKHRAPQHVKKNRKRTRELDWQDTRVPAWVAWLSVLCLIALFAGVLALSTSDRTAKPMNINGDQLGPIGMTVEEYDGFAHEQLVAAQGTQERWALVSPPPDQPWDQQELSDLVRGLDARVSTFYFGPAASIPAAEPAAGHTRADVVERIFATAAAQDGVAPEQVRCDGLLVYATPEVLRELEPRVFAVEPAHPEAVYGLMGIRPVSAA
ncbi:MAG TPA: hypothetical protein H9867_08640 [Candidatus Corynebacterium gallistercoris]|uniref:Uncharacterized protein n=1 Tax=Candidatus Corynebacterium gallistercoris TaxID=2838530 RepID=A0A9D1RZA9_9CORY|nr:hypothetical protein [Candidatus Corynebacterium gallistercoris]